MGSESPAGRPELDVFSWLAETEPTWASWTVGALVGTAAAVYGARGLLAKMRNEPATRFIPEPLPALGYFVFGVWVLWVFAISRLPG